MYYKTVQTVRIEQYRQHLKLLCRKPFPPPESTGWFFSPLYLLPMESSSGLQVKPQAVYTDSPCLGLRAGLGRKGADTGSAASPDLALLICRVKS